MPEKPEVITVAKALSKKIIGRTISSVDVYWDNIIATPSVKEFKTNIINQKILDIKTRGKFIVIVLESYLLLIHLRMEGKFFFRNQDDPLEKHEHIVFTFSDNEEMRYHDVRKFGKMYLLDKHNAYEVAPLCELGYEYDDKRLDGTYLKQKLKKKSLPIKTTLLDQTIITGIGNIYDDEILFLSHISPFKKSCDLTLKDCNEIVRNTKIVLERAIALGGTTIKSFTSSEGVHGLFQNELNVHGKKKGKCPICSSEIINVKINGRGTYYCKKCQK